MLNTEKLLNQYGLTLEEAEQLLQTDIITKLMSVRDMEGTAITQQLPLIDSSVVDYLNSNEVKAVLEANAKEPIADEDLGEFEDLEIDTTFDIDSGDLGDFDLRVTDIDVGDLGDLGELGELGDEPQEEQPPVVVAPVKEAKKEPTTIEAYKISGVDVAEFLLMLGANEVPQVDSGGSLVVKANGILMKATFVDDFGMLSTMPLNSEQVDVLFVTNNKEVDFEGARLGGKEGEFVVVDASELSPSLEEVNSVFDTQQYSVDNTEATISFDAVSTMLASIEKFDAEFSSKMVLPLGVAIDSDMTFASQFFIDPATLYELANCDTFFQASVATRNYITNYCEANDLEHLRIFELGGEHLNIPLARFIGTSISDQVIENTAFSERVNKIVTPSVQSNQKLKEVGFVPATPKGIAYNRVDSLSELAGFMVYVAEDSSEIVYIPSVVVNYFEKYYGKLQLNIGSIKAGDYRVVMFMSADSDVMQGFYLVDADKVKPAKPARLLPTNPLATQAKVRGEHSDAFTNKIDLAKYLELEILYLGDVREQPEIEVNLLDMDIATTPSEQEGGGDAIADLRNQVALNQEAISIMTIGEDDELISELQDEIDFLESMISDLGGGTSDDEILEVQIEESFDEGDLELGEMKVGNDQEILPTPSADDPVVEDITDLEVDAIENDDYDFEVELADEPSMEADDDVEAELEIDEDDDIEVNPAPTFEDEDEDEDFDTEGDIDLGDIDLDFAKGGLTSAELAKRIFESQSANGQFKFSEDQIYKNIDYFAKQARFEYDEDDFTWNRYAKGGAVPTRKTSMRKVMEGVRKSDGGPYTAMAWMGTRLDEQRLIRYPQEVPLAVEKLRNDFPNSRIEVEDVTGRIFYVGTPTREVSFAKGGEVDLHSGGYDVDKILKIIRVDSSDSELGFGYVEDFLELGAFEWDKNKINRYFDELIQKVKQFDYGEGQEAQEEKEGEIREIEQDRKGALALDFEDDFFLDEKIGIGRDDDALDFVNRFFKINEKRLVEVAPQVFKKYDDMFAKGGSVAPPVRDVQKTIDAMTDIEVADKLTKLMYQSLESAEYEMSESDAYQYALDNIADARRYLIEIVTEMELQDELS